jgi:hypothetical protein
LSAAALEALIAKQASALRAEHMSFVRILVENIGLGLRLSN